MRHVLLVAVFLATPHEHRSLLGAQEATLDSVLRFEAPRTASGFHGWSGGPPETIHLDSVVVHGGRHAMRLERIAESGGRFTTITARLPIDFTGRRITLRGFLRTEGVTGFAGLWMREDGPAGGLQFDNMQARQLSGTTDWTAYTIDLPLDERARDLYLGVLLSGTGTVWADDLELLVDGTPLSQVARHPPPTTILDTDTQFAGGSGITLTALTPVQVEHLAILGTVWGFLKYHHPRIAAGELHWDFELFRVLPRVLVAPDRRTLQRSLADWVDSVGMPARCNPCARAPEDPHLLPRLDWLRDETLLGAELSRRLREIHRNRFAGDSQFYVSRVRGVGNPVFDRELPYAGQRPPDAGYRILALFRLWNIVEYWFPYRDLLDDDWSAVLREELPRFVAAADRDAYRLALLALIARVKDTHANLWSDLDVRPPRGQCGLPVSFRFVEGALTVDALGDSAPGGAGLAVGDVVETVDGAPVDSLVTAWSPYYAASNVTTRLRDIARFIGRGDCGDGTLRVRRQGEARTVTATRVAGARAARVTHDRPGEAFQLLSPEVAYLKLSNVKAADAPEYVRRAAGTRGLVIDIRNYPSEFVVFALGSHLVRAPTPFARFTVGDPGNPGAFLWGQPVRLGPQPPIYQGKVVILVDEVSISQAEYTAMAFRAAPDAVVVGSTTAGADGNVSAIPLPGGLRTMISGIGVFYPDKTPTQRVGIIPDVVVTPTINGIAGGRDEVLEEAIRQILGRDVTEDTVRRMAGSPIDR